MSDVKKTTISLSASQSMPDICISCGSYTDRRTRVKHTEKRLVKVRDSRREDMGWMTLFLGPAALLLWKCVDFFTSKRKKVISRILRIRVPYCALCGCESPLSPVSVDLRRTRFRFLAHDRFIAELSRLNKSAV